MMRASRLVLLATGLLALFGLGLPRPADAQANYGCNITTGSWVPVLFALPSQISLPANPTSGTVLWTSAPTAASGTPPTLDCKGPPRNGLQDHITSNPMGGATFNTYAPGLGYRIIRSDTGNPITVYPGEPTMPAGNNFGNLSYQLQLVWTGPIAPGQTLGAYELGSWNVSVNNGDYFGFQVIDFQTSGLVALTPTACSVAVDPTVVQLPTTSSSRFGSQGSTDGTTAFNIQLNCQSSGKVAITLSTANPVAPSVLVNTGTAAGVGVQLLYQGSPVTFGTAIALGSTGPGPVSIPFSARYYQTRATLPTGGSVNATATYTLTYP